MLYLDWLFTGSSNVGSGGSRYSMAGYAFQNSLVISDLDNDPPLDELNPEGSGTSSGAEDTVVGV